MKAILINPETQTATTVDHDGDLASVKRLIECHMIDAARLPGTNDVIYVDDEGLFQENQHFFKYAGYHQPLAGKGLLVGTGPEGEDMEPDTSLFEVIGRVLYLGQSVEG
jgi:hypothetical protein